MVTGCPRTKAVPIPLATRRREDEHWEVRGSSCRGRQRCAALISARFHKRGGLLWNEMLK